MRRFYLTTIPGLESATHLELCSWWGRATAFFDLPPYPKVKILKAGIEFEAPLPLGLEMQKVLRLPNRILLRLSEWDAPNERDFLVGLKQVPWEDYFATTDSFSYQFTSKSSKISMKKQVQSCLEKTFKPLKLKYSKDGVSLFIRLFRDRCQLSIDCTGDLAFKRGGQAKGSIASLRETTASGLLRILLQGQSEPFVLIDPMCGSGTLLNESLSVNQPLEREFVFEKYPIVNSLSNQESGELESKTQLNRREIDSDKVVDCFSANPIFGVKQVGSDEAHLKPQKVYGFDNQDKAIHLAKQNLSSWSEDEVCVQKADLFDKKQGLVSEETLKKIVVVNPPWGKRLPGSSQDLLKIICEKYQPDRLGLLMPAKWRISPIPMEKVRDIPILNSGVENRFLVFAKGIKE